MPHRRFRFAGLLALLGLGAAVAGLVLAAPAEAVPARPGVIELRQPNGDVFEARRFGDEWYNGHETRSGHTVLRGEQGRWRYAEQSPDGSLTASGPVVGRGRPTTRPHLRDRSLLERADRRQVRRDRVSLEPRVGGPQQLPSAGTDKSLVILASFDDQGSLGTSPAQWSAAYFGAGKSVAGYYAAASGGTFTLGPAAESHGTPNDGVVGWVGVGMNHPNTTITGDANRAATRAAIVAADPYVDYAAYDTDGDGVVRNTELHVTVIAAGQEASCCQNWGAKSLWGHMWSLHGTVPPPTVDGKSVGGWGYTQFGEMHGDHQAALGIMAHEIGHDLDLPDLYDTDGSSNGVGTWSVMGAGSWNKTATDAYAGMTPPLPDAWSRWYKGWITPAVVTGTATRDIQAASSGTTGVAVQLRDNPAGPHDWNWGTGATGEYFLVENRQQTPGSYDESLPGSGLLVWHVDETRSGNAEDAARLVDVEEADGLRHLDTGANRGDAGDLYRQGGSTTFNALTNPHSNLNNGSASGVSMSGVGPSGATMSATFTAPSGHVLVPANDIFSSAQVVPGRVFDSTGDTTSATVEAGETSQTGCHIGRTLWYRYTPTEDVRVRATTAGSSFDTVLEAWRGTSLADLTPLGCNDDAGDLTSAIPEFVAQAGQTYYFQAGGYYNSATGAVAAGNLQFHLRARPVNDDFAQATAIGGSTGTSTGNNVSASKQPGEPAHAGNAGGTSVWWSWTAPSSGPVQLDTVGSAASDTLLGVYTGASVGALSLVAGNDDIDPATERRSRVTFTAVAGATYRIAVDSYAGTTPGGLSLTWALAAPTASAPAAPTGVAANPGNGTATVTWTPGAANGSPITGYTVTSSPGGITKDVGPGTTSTQLAGLTNGTPYTFTVTATNAIGTSPPSAPSGPVTPQGVTDLGVGLTLLDRPGTTTFAYRATVQRTGGPGTGPVLVDLTLPGSLTVINAPGCVTGPSLACDLGAITQGGSEHVDVTVRPRSPGPHAVTAALVVGGAHAGNDAADVEASIDFVCDNEPTGGKDTVTGTAAADILCGSGGDDAITGRGGDDLVFGGPGVDTLAYDRAPGAMVVNLNFQDLSADTAWQRGGTGDGADLATEVERVRGTRFDDVLVGGLDRDGLWGLGGNDRITGDGGPDLLYGGGGADNLFGGAQSDLLVGGTGRDRLDGGTGRDTCKKAPDTRVRCEA